MKLCYLQENSRCAPSPTGIITSQNLCQHPCFFPLSELPKLSLTCPVLLPCLSSWALIWHLVSKFSCTSYGPICVNSTASLLQTSAGFLELSLNPLYPFPWNSLLICYHCNKHYDLKSYNFPRIFLDSWFHSVPSYQIILPKILVSPHQATS